MINDITRVLALLLVVQQTYIFLTGVRHSRERTDLLNRLMAKDSIDYAMLKDNVSEKKTHSNTLKENLKKDGLMG